MHRLHRKSVKIGNRANFMSLKSLISRVQKRISGPSLVRVLHILMYQDFTVTERHYRFTLIPYIFTAPLFRDHPRAKMFQALGAWYRVYTTTTSRLLCKTLYYTFFSMLLFE